MNPNQNALEQFSIPGKITLSQDESYFWKVNVETAVSKAEVYLQGAHVTSFQKKRRRATPFYELFSSYGPSSYVAWRNSALFSLVWES